VTILSAASSVLINVARLIEMEGMMRVARDIKTFKTVTFLHLNVLLNVYELTIKDETMNLAEITPTSLIVTSHPRLHQSVRANVVGRIMKDEMMKVARSTRLFVTVTDRLQLQHLAAPQHVVIHLPEESLTLAVNNTKTSIGIALFLNLWWWNLNVMRWILSAMTKLLKADVQTNATGNMDETVVMNGKINVVEHVLNYARHTHVRMK